MGAEHPKVDADAASAGNVADGAGAGELAVVTQDKVAVESDRSLANLKNLAHAQSLCHTETMKLLKNSQPKTPLTHTDEFTAEEIAAFFLEEYGVDLSDANEELLLCYVDVARQGGAEAVDSTYKSGQELSAYIRNRSPEMVYHDSFVVEQHQMDRRLRAQESQS